MARRVLLPGGAVLALLAWLLIGPPIRPSDVTHPYAFADTGTPLSQWLVLRSYDSRDACSAASMDLGAVFGMYDRYGNRDRTLKPGEFVTATYHAVSHVQCISSEDRRLEGRPK